jgi:two-component system, chemotaxis family, protein-glutamate methylesterase/glutaminase
MSKIKILIVDDSALMRKILTKMISEDGDMEIIGQASDPFEARDLLMSTL